MGEGTWALSCLGMVMVLVGLSEGVRARSACKCADGFSEGKMVVCGNIVIQ
jgi:hypothetical protein